MAEFHHLGIYHDPDGGGTELALLTDCSTDPTHPHPYLIAPALQTESRVALAEGSSTIGEYTVRVEDAVPPEGTTGWLTGILAPRGGTGWLRGRRARLERQVDGTGLLLVDGIIGDVRVEAGEPRVYVLAVRDARERERRSGAFPGGSWMSTSTVLPRGVLHGYGRLPGGGWLVPPPRPLTGTFRRFAADEESGAGSVLLDGWTRSGTVPADLVLTPAMRQVLKREWSEAAGGWVLGREVGVMWRPLPTPELPDPRWTELFRMPLPTGEGEELRRFNLGGVLVATPSRTVQVDDHGEREVDALAAAEVRLHPVGAAGVPGDGDRVEVMIRYVGPPTEAYPLHLEASAGLILSNLYDGLNPTIQYDEVRVFGMVSTTPVLRARVTRPVDDMKRWVEENLYRPLGMAPALSRWGAVSPIRYTFPDAPLPVPVIDGSVATDAAWESPDGGAVSTACFTYLRDSRVPAERDPLGVRSAGDGIVSESLTVEYAAESLPAQGSRVMEYAPVTFRTLGGVEGEQATGDLTDETAHQLARQRVREVVDRFSTGTPYLRVTCWTSAVAALKVGDWVRLSLPDLPPAPDGTAGDGRLAQVVGTGDVDPTRRELRLCATGATNTGNTGA